MSWVGPRLQIPCSVASVAPKWCCILVPMCACVCVYIYIYIYCLSVYQDHTIPCHGIRWYCIAMHYMTSNYISWHVFYIKFLYITYHKAKFSSFISGGSNQFNRLPKKGRHFAVPVSPFLRSITSWFLGKISYDNRILKGPGVVIRLIFRNVPCKVPQSSQTEASGLARNTPETLGHTGTLKNPNTVIWFTSDFL